MKTEGKKRRNQETIGNLLTHDEFRIRKSRGCQEGISKEFLYGEHRNHGSEGLRCRHLESLKACNPNYGAGTACAFLSDVAGLFGSLVAHDGWPVPHHKHNLYNLFYSHEIYAEY